MNDRPDFLSRLIWSAPERRWWGERWIPTVGFLVGSWFWFVEQRLVTGISLFGTSIAAEVILFHLVIKPRRRRGQ